jgi:transposase InsO family protein
MQHSCVMPWKETGPVEERVKFVAAVLEGGRTVRGLCDAFGISRKQAYKWLGRFRNEGPEGLVDRSRAPKCSPQRTAPAMEALIVALRERHPTWGPKKIVGHLVNEKTTNVPAVSTVGEILVRHGLVQKRLSRSRQVGYASPLEHAEAPNDVWCVDFKGDFRMTNGRRCYPLTMTDAFSRYLLCCRGLRSTRSETAREIFEATFRKFGLPWVIRSDNGVPFSSTGGLSALAVWWIKLGIRPERIEPGRPEQNGRHERMHRTLKAEATKPPRANHDAQQQAFNAFVKTYNDVRPHEALGQIPPAQLYQRSPREYPRRLQEMAYPSHYEVRCISATGNLKFKGELFFLSHSLRQERVGFEPIDDGLWAVHFGLMRLGVLDERLKKIAKRIELGLQRLSPMSPV